MANHAITRKALLKGALLLLPPLAVCVLATAFWFVVLPYLREGLKAGVPENGGPVNEAAPRLLGKDAIALPHEIVTSLHIQISKAETCKYSRALAPMPGSLALDSNRLARIHTRFAGEVIEIGSCGYGSCANGQGSADGRPLQFGDRVEKRQLLAVIWSKELGEKKSELIDALSQLRLDIGTQRRLDELQQIGAIPEARIHEARRAVEASQIAVAKAERTLRSWRLEAAEIAALHAEAKRAGESGNKRDPKREEAWARVEVRAPMSGVILEKNFAVGDLVDTGVDLFKIADLSRLNVLAHIFEEDLPELLSLPRPIPWTIHLKSANGASVLSGSIDMIGELVDPVQHTVLVTGHVENPNGALRSGQFVTTVVAPAAEGTEVQLPTSALVEDGEESVVFVQLDPTKPEFVMRKVAVLRRAWDFVTVDGNGKGNGIRAGEWVVTRGAVQLRTILEKLQPAPPEAQAKVQQ